MILGESVFDNQNGFEYWSAPKLQLAMLLGLIGLVALAGIASASVALGNMHGWYAVLTPPPLAPPSPLPAAAWGVLAILYVVMAIAAWLVLRRTHPVTVQNSAMHMWGWQLALGAAWPAVFFGFHAMLAALAVAAALLASAVATVQKFVRLDAIAAILLGPNLVLCGFLFYLSAGFWWLNH